MVIFAASLTLLVLMGTWNWVSMHNWLRDNSWLFGFAGVGMILGPMLVWEARQHDLWLRDRMETRWGELQGMEDEIVRERFRQRVEE